MINPVHKVLEILAQQKNYIVIQIGAYIGNTLNDPLFDKLSTQLNEGNGRLICVEPVKEYFDNLVKNYWHTKNVYFENVAIADHSGESTFYRLGVDPAQYGYPDWLSQLGSLKQERMESLWDRYESDKELKSFFLKHRIEETVKCMTFSDLLCRHHVKEVDLLQIDVEGYELEILSSIDFRKTPVHFINYECVLLHEFKYKCEQMMTAQGYTFFDHGQDTLCFKK